MSDYTVAVYQSRKLLKQRYHVTIAAANGEKLFTSEMYTNESYAIQLAQEWAGICDGNFIDRTGE